MTLSPIGCDVISHEPNCLCDVVITKPVAPAYLAIPHEMLNGEALAYFGKWDGTVEHWCELVDKTTSHIRRFRKHLLAIPENDKSETSDLFECYVDPLIRLTLEPSRHLPEEIRLYVLKKIRQGIDPAPLRRSVIEEFGYVISKSYVTQTRKRLNKRGEL